MDTIRPRDAQAFLDHHNIELGMDRRNPVQFCEELNQLAAAPNIDLTDPVTVSGLRELIRLRDQPDRRPRLESVNNGAY